MVTKRSAERHVTATCPGWLQPNGDRYKILKSHAATVNRAFKLAIDGWSLDEIADKLTRAERPLVRSGRRGDADDDTTWTKTTVQFLLNNRHVLGNKAYRYPPIVREHDFDMAQKALKAIQRSGRRGGRNFFAGLMVCDECGTKIRRRATYFECPLKHFKHNAQILEEMIGEAVWNEVNYFIVHPWLKSCDEFQTKSGAHVRRHIKQIRVRRYYSVSITRVDGEVIEFPGRSRDPVPEEVLRLVPTAAKWW